MVTIKECLEPNRGTLNEGGRWLCVCDCGAEIERTGYGFTRNGVSCGCYRRGHKPGRGPARRGYAQTTVNAAYSAHKQNCRKKGMVPLDRMVWEGIVFKPCYYCGNTDVKNYADSCVSKAQYMAPEELEKYIVRMNGVDRLDNLSYADGVCVPCCSMCNYMKAEHSPEIFIAHLRKVLAFWDAKLDKVPDCAKNE